MSNEITPAKAKELSDSELRDTGAILTRKKSELEKKMDWDTYRELESVGQQKFIVDNEIKNRGKSIV